VALHLRRLRTARYQQGRTQPARRRPPIELPAMIGYFNGGAVAGLPQDRGPPVFLNPAQAITVASASPPTVSATSPDPWTCSLQGRRSASKECLVSGLRIRAAWHSECHSRQVRYSVLDSKNCHYLDRSSRLGLSCNNGCWSWLRPQVKGRVVTVLWAGPGGVALFLPPGFRS
jgi:hypothetical protein